MSEEQDELSSGLNNGYGSIGSENDSNGQRRQHDETERLMEDAGPGNSCAPPVDPFDDASWWSRLVFGWLSPLLELGRDKNRLDMEDLETVPLPFQDTTEQVMDCFQKAWQNERLRCNANSDSATNKSSKPSLTRALWHAFCHDFIQAGYLKFVHDLLQFVGPLVLNRLIIFLRTPEAPLWHGIALVFIVTAAQLLMSLCLRHYFFKCYRVGMRVRTAIIGAVYQKALRVSTSETHSSVGQITNLMSVDAQRLQDTITYLHSVWYSVLQIGLALFFLWQQLGPSCLTGVAVILLSIPLTAMAAMWMGKLQKKLMTAKDARIEINNEVLGHIKIVKLQAWEKPFQEKLEQLRYDELQRLFCYLAGRTVTFLMWSAVPLTISLGTFATYVLVGNQLDVASALTALALFDILRFPLFMLPNTINSMVEANVSIDRLYNFLTSQEHHTVPDKPSAGVKMKDASFVYDNKRPANEDGTKIDKSEWEMQLLQAQLADAKRVISKLEGTNGDGEGQPSDLLSLSRINFACQEGEFIAVVGAVGSGKSTLLKAILGEVRRLCGSHRVSGKIAYFAQEPFIMNATVKENILFDKAVDTNPELYNLSIDSCALGHDLLLLPQGDSTEIGEKGITLSGGQKARIGLARTLMHDAEIFLLDDPLAAVDANVGRHIFEECIVNQMCVGGKDGVRRTVILVTNALQYLNHEAIDRIVVLEGGNIKEMGNYQDLHDDETSLFRRFVDTMNEKRSEGGASPSTTKTEGAQGSAAKETSATSQEVENTQQLKKGRLMTDEMQERETGTVGLDVYLTWINSAGGFWVFVVVVGIYMFSEAGHVLSNWWLTNWSEHAGKEGYPDQMWYLTFYGIINFSLIFTDLSRSIVLYLCALRASRTMFSRVLESTLRAPMAFFDTTPLGRIINRFSKDMYSVDESLPSSVETYLWCLMTVFSTLIVVSSITPQFTVCLLPILWIYRMEQKYFTVSYRELKRLDSVNRSPIYALFSETLDGVDTIRAFSAQRSLQHRMTNMLDGQQHAYFLLSTGQCWLAVRLELLGTLIVFGAALAAVLEHGMHEGTAFAGLAGLSISYSLTVTQELNWTVRVASDCEADMVAVERIEQYCSLQSEAASETPEDEVLPPDWPSSGVIEFKDVKLRYRSGLPLVLKGLTLKIPAHSKVGVVGRTGAGKSTLMTALMRLVEVDSGAITIDSVDIATLGLCALRSKIAVIPQDPVLFSGSIKANLDPFGRFNDEKLEQVLVRVGLMAEDRALGAVKSLSHEVLDGGNNFSVGQRQLIVIGRSLLQEASVVIADEATAAVDSETDGRIQTILRTDFAKATCLTIAHRINTILDSDYVLTMSDGQCAEFDTPANLLQKDSGIFKSLVETWEKEHHDA